MIAFLQIKPSYRLATQRVNDPIAHEVPTYDSQILPKIFNSCQSKALRGWVAMVRPSLEILSEVFLAKEIFQKKKKKGLVTISRATYDSYNIIIMIPFLLERNLCRF